MDERPSVSATAPQDAPASEVEQLRRELEEKSDRYLRALAEMENTKRRAQRQREEHIQHAHESLIRELLPALDHFDRALEAARTRGDAAPRAGGIALIQR